MYHGAVIRAVSPANDSYYVTAPLLWPLILGLRMLGVDADEVLARAGLSEQALRDPDARFSAAEGLSLMNAAIAVSGDPDLGLHLSQHYEPGIFTVLDYLAHSSATLREAIERVCRYERLHQNGVRTTLRVQGARAILRQDTLVALPLPRQVAESSLANLLTIGRKLTGKPLMPHEVWFRHAEPATTREHERIFGCTLHFEAEYDALIFDAAWLDLPLPHKNPALGETLERHARELLAKLARGDSLADQVRRELSALLPDGSQDIERVAKRLHTSARTLQRRLRDEGTTFAALLEELRIELSLRYLAEPSLGVEDVALMLGFSDSRAFRRAFKRWKGVSPGSLRGSLRSKAARGG